MREESLMTGSLETTNAPYAMAKLARIEMVKSYRKQYGRNYISVIPTNLYGPHDHFDGDRAHVPAALLKRFHDAKTNGDESVTIWGSGEPKREFMHVDDLADACVFLMQNYNDIKPINIGSGEEISVQDFAILIADIVGFNGSIKNDLSKPDGMMRKLLDCRRLNDLGWQAKIGLREGLESYYAWYLDHQTKKENLS